MAPIPGNSCSSSGFRQEIPGRRRASCYDDMESKQPIPADYSRDRSIIIAGKHMDTSSSRRQPPSKEKSLLTLKRRGTSSDASSSGAGDSFVIVPSKKRRVEDATSAYGYGIIPVQTHRYDTAVDAPPKPSSSSVTSGLPALQQKKHMHDGMIRDEQSGGVRYALLLFPQAACNGGAMAARAKKMKKTNERPRLSPWGAALSGCLSELGVTAAQFVRTKTLNNSDVCSNQNRLLMSCKPEFVTEHPITWLLGEKEAYFVFEHEHGLRVKAYDAEGRERDMRLRYLISNGGFRLIDKWGGFVKENGLRGPEIKGRQVVDVEVWAFRSKELPKQPELDDEDREEMVQGLKDHPDGYLGVLVLPYVDDGEVRVEEDEERAPRTKKAKAVQKQKKLADHASRPGKKAVAREVTLSDMIVEHGMELAMSVAGLLKLVYSHVAPVPTLTTMNVRGQTFSVDL